MKATVGFCTLFGIEAAKTMYLALGFRNGKPPTDLAPYEQSHIRLAILQSKQWETIRDAFGGYFKANHKNVRFAQLGHEDYDFVWTTGNSLTEVGRQYQSLPYAEQDVLLKNIIRGGIILRRLEQREKEAYYLAAIWKSLVPSLPEPKGGVPREADLKLAGEFLYSLKIVPGKNYESHDFPEEFKRIRMLDREFETFIRKATKLPESLLVAFVELRGRILEWDSYRDLMAASPSVSLVPLNLVRRQRIQQAIEFNRLLDKLSIGTNLSSETKGDLIAAGVFTFDAFRLDLMILAALEPDNPAVLEYRHYVMKAMEAHSTEDFYVDLFEAMLGAIDLDVERMYLLTDRQTYNLLLNRFYCLACQHLLNIRDNTSSTERLSKRSAILQIRMDDYIQQSGKEKNIMNCWRTVLANLSRLTRKP